MMTVVLPLLVLLATALGTGLVRRYALARSLMDIPNARSSHKVPTPRGGGVAIAVAATIGFAALAFSHRLDTAGCMALLGGVAVAAIGFMDDRQQVPVRIRLCVHLVAAAWAVFWLGGLPTVQIGSLRVDPGYAGYALGMLGIVWALNLFNFMDGTDGIAGSEGAYMAFAAAGVLIDSAAVAAPASMVFGAACLGFLAWNWPPARIFMGDVGSGYLGFIVAVLAIMSMRSDPVALWIWLILGGAFFVDATVTVIRRLVRGERIHEAHRSHAYQWLSRRWGSHLRVLFALVSVNILWLLPCAWVASRRPDLAAWMVLIALVPLVVAFLAAGAGRREGQASGTVAG